MQPSSDQILDALSLRGYKIDIVLDHREMVPFVSQNLRNRNLIMYMFWTIMLTGILFFLYQAAKLVSISGFLDMLIWSIGGLMATILLIPFHEGIHGIAYKLCGARDVTFGANWRQLYFTASAHGFVANYSRFLLIGLAPFLVINIAGLYLYAKSDATAGMLIASCLLVHNSMCIGDFSIISYLHIHRLKQPLTFDDVKASRSFFLIKE